MGTRGLWPTWGDGAGIQAAEAGRWPPGPIRGPAVTHGPVPMTSVTAVTPLCPPPSITHPANLRLLLPTELFPARGQVIFVLFKRL